MGDKGRSNVYYGADLEGALAFQPAGVGWGIKIEVTFITMPTWRSALPPYRARRLSSRQGRLGDKGRSNVYYDADLEVGAPALPGAPTF